jgi:crotonobetainyl-CoA:carnitine CoA-transferase CaiB-like acyl-CoA transferase
MSVEAPPLAGVRVIDLTAWQAGPQATMILADYGADVVKIEAPQRLDGWRGGAGLTADRMYERNPFWNAVNRGKLSISLDLAAAEGRRLFLRLVEDADVVVENFTARVMANLDLAYETLQQVNPAVVMASLSGFGQTGPWRDYSAFAFPTEEASGLAFLNGERGGPPVLIGTSVTDAMVAAMGAVAILAALERRAATGHGDYIDLSQIETLTTFIAGELVQATLTGGDGERVGNERPGLCPHGLFPCRPEGQRVAIAVRGDDEWRDLCAVLERGDLLADPALATAAGREEQRPRVDDAVRAWTATRDGAAVAATLQAVGIPAAVAVRSSELAADDHLWVREFYRILDREEVGAHPYPGPVVRLSATPAVIERPSPLYGEHTTEILRTRLGLSDEEIAALRAAGVTSTEPLAQDWR